MIKNSYYPVSTRRQIDVVSTSYNVKWRQTNVVLTSCVSWVKLQCNSLSFEFNYHSPCVYSLNDYKFWIFGNTRRVFLKPVAIVQTQLYDEYTPHCHAKGLSIENALNFNGGERFEKTNDLVTIPTLSSFNFSNILCLPLG